jgi:hypothetical protein
MRKREDQTPNHLANGLLVKAIDDELLPSELAQVEGHLSACEECKRRYQDLRVVSDHVESLASAIIPRASTHAREALVRKLDGRQPQQVTPGPGKVLRRFSWGMAVAATLAIGILFAPHNLHTASNGPSLSSTLRSIDTFDVNGETFVALPYSNPDLPVSTSHIVQMQVPVSSLTDAGIAFEPVSTDASVLNHSVLADVLVGMDGQPLGVHVLSAE